MRMNYGDFVVVWIDIEHSINNLFDFYETQFGNKQSSHLASSSRPRSSVLSGFYLYQKDQEAQTH